MAYNKGETSAEVGVYMFNYLEVKKMNTTSERLELVKGITTLRLKFSTRILLVKLIDLVDDSDSIIVERLTLAALCNVSGETVGRAIKQLKTLEYIGVEMRRAMGEKGKVTRTANKHVINFQRIALAIRERNIEIEREVRKLAA